MKVFSNTRSIVFILAASMALHGCFSQKADFASCVSAVTVLPQDNALRADVELQLRQACSFRILFWPSDKDRSLARSTGWYSESAGSALCHLNFLEERCRYTLQIELDNGSESKCLEFATTSLPVDIPSYEVEYLSPGFVFPDGYLLQWDAAAPGYLTICDLNGKIIWYQAFGQGIRTACFDRRSGQFAVLCGFADGEDSEDFYRLASDVYVCDINGEILFHRKPSEYFVPYPHHEFSILENGDFLIMSNVVKPYALGEGSKSVDIWGDGFYVCDREGNVRFSWDCFSELNPVEVDYINAEKVANDYVHANSVVMDSEGDFYVTLNRINELWKISGKTFDVLYRVGTHGNVALDADSASYGFPSGGLHAATVIGPDRILCYDNGKQLGYSRALLFEVNQAAGTVNYELVVDLPKECSSVNRSNVQIVSADGSLLNPATIGPDDLLLFGSTSSAKAVFEDMEGTVLYVLSRSGISYRTYWIPAGDLEI